MLFTEFNMDDALRVRGEECFEEGLQKGIQALIETCMEFKVSRADTLVRIQDKFHLSENEAEKYLNKYWPV